MWERWKQRARGLRREAYAVYLACRDPRTPWYARLLAAAVVAYAFSPLDLVPDFVPVLGYLDDLVLVPLGLAAVIRLIPPAVMAECRAQAETALERPRSWRAAAVVVAIWLLLAVGAGFLVVREVR